MSNLFNCIDSQKIHYRPINEDGTDVSGDKWLVTYEVKNMISEYDDNMGDDGNIIEVIITASTFDNAVKYAQQYIRKKQSEDDNWIDADILSVQLR